MVVALSERQRIQTYLRATQSCEPLTGESITAEWSPWQTLEVLRREIDRVFDENGSRREPASRAAFLPGRAARRYPLINLYDDKEAVYVEALAPGIDPSSLNLHVQGNTLSMTGEKRRVAGDVP